jgi:hypothetical protein
MKGEYCTRCGREKDSNCKVTLDWKEGKEIRYNDCLCMLCWDELSLWLKGTIWGNETDNYLPRPDPRVTPEVSKT